MSKFYLECCACLVSNVDRLLNPHLSFLPKIFSPFPLFVYKNSVLLVCIFLLIILVCFAIWQNRIQPANSPGTKCVLFYGGIFFRLLLDEPNVSNLQASNAGYFPRHALSSCKLLLRFFSLLHANIRNSSTTVNTIKWNSNTQQHHYRHHRYHYQPIPPSPPPLPAQSPGHLPASQHTHTHTHTIT